MIQNNDWKNSKYFTPRKTSFATSAKRFLEEYNKRNPGPCNYDTSNKLSKIGISKVHQSNGCQKFDLSKRKTYKHFEKRDITPGPGSYNTIGDIKLPKIRQRRYPSQLRKQK